MRGHPSPSSSLPSGGRAPCLPAPPRVRLLGRPRSQVLAGKVLLEPLRAGSQGADGRHPFALHSEASQSRGCAGENPRPAPPAWQREGPRPCLRSTRGVASLLRLGHSWLLCTPSSPLAHTRVHAHTRTAFYCLDLFLFSSSFWHISN